MIHCERCGSRFHSARAMMLDHCPRCLLRDDVAAPLKRVEIEPEPDTAAESPPPSEPGEIAPTSSSPGI